MASASVLGVVMGLLTGARARISVPRWVMSLVLDELQTPDRAAYFAGWDRGHACHMHANDSEEGFKEFALWNLTSRSYGRTRGQWLEALDNLVEGPETRMGFEWTLHEISEMTDDQLAAVVTHLTAIYAALEVKK